MADPTRDTCDNARADLLAAAALLAPVPTDAADRATLWWPTVRALAMELGTQTQLLRTTRSTNVASATFTGTVTAVEQHRSGRAVITIKPDNRTRSNTDYGYTDFLTNPAGIELCLTAAAAIGQHVAYGKRRETKSFPGGSRTRPDGTTETTPRIDWVRHTDGTPIIYPTTAEELLTRASALGIAADLVQTLSNEVLAPLQATQHRSAHDCAVLWAAIAKLLPHATLGLDTFGPRSDSRS